MYPNSKGYLVSIFERATINAHSYLFLDLHQKTSAILKVQARILPSERQWLHLLINSCTTKLF